MAKRPVSAPVVRNLAELGRDLPEGDLRVHFTKKQWTDLVKGVPVSKGLPERGGRLEFTPDPNGDGTAQFVCNPGPAEECRQLMVPGRDGVRLECHCTLTEVPDGGGGGDGGDRGPIPSQCVLILPTSGRRARCLGVHCRGRCELRLVRHRHLYALFCTCVEGR